MYKKKKNRHPKIVIIKNKEGYDGTVIRERIIRTE